MLVRYLPGFVVPSGSGREIAAVFALGRCRGRCASRRDRMRTTHLSLVVAAFCSRPRLQFARGCPTRPWCDTCTSYNGSSFSSFFPPLFFFCRLVLKKIPGILEQKMFAAACCMFTIKNSFFFAFLSLPNKVYASQGRMVIVLYQRSRLLQWLYSWMHTSFENGAGTIAHSPRYVSIYNQSIPTTKTLVRICSCSTLFYT